MTGSFQKYFPCSCSNCAFTQTICNKNNTLINDCLKSPTSTFFSRTLLPYVHSCCLRISWCGFKIEQNVITLLKSEFLSSRYLLNDTTSSRSKAAKNLQIALLTKGTLQSLNMICVIQAVQQEKSSYDDI